MGASPSSNTTLGGEKYVDDFQHISVPYLLLTSIAMLVGTLGNILVLATIAINRDLHKAGSIFMVNLAAADILVAAFMDPLSLTGMVKGRAFFDARPVLCEMASVICVCICICALLCIGAISFQQFVQICHHELYQTIFNVRNNAIFCLVFWIAGFLVAVPTLSGWASNIYDPKMLECIWDRTHSRSYTIFYVSVAVFLPLVVISYSYTRIFLHVRASKRRIQKIQVGTGTGTLKIPNGPVKSKKDPTRLARTLFVIFIVFAICWTPYSILVLVDFEDKLPHEVHLYALLLAHLHASADPVVYGLTNKHFQQGYRMVGHFLLCRGSRVSVAIGDTSRANGAEGHSKTRS